MLDFEKLANFLSHQSEKSKEDEKIVLSQLWKEKELIIDKFITAYSSILEAFYNKEQSNFTNEFEKAIELNKSINESVIYCEDYNQFNLDEAYFCNEDYLASIKEILSPQYDPRALNPVIIRDHLWVLWNFYRWMPIILKNASISITLFTKIEVSTLKIFAYAGQIMMNIYVQGNSYDFGQKRGKNISKAKQIIKDISKKEVLAIYHKIYAKGKPKHTLANEIKESINNGPSITTIKRWLGEEKLPPFDN